LLIRLKRKICCSEITQ